MTASLEQPNARLEALFRDSPVSAGAFIVTLYGDVVAPRGGELWTGNIVQTLAMVGIGESRVRTALSRLVAAGHLEGTKAGRRSFYRLTETAATEFTAAARLIYAPVEPPPLVGWHLVLLPPGGREAHGAALARARFGFVSPQLAVLPDRGDPLPRLPGTHFRARTCDDLSAPLAEAWPLEALADRARTFIALFGELESAATAPVTALANRLLLVHAFREIALGDPRLPADLLPADWPGDAARALFARLYAALSKLAEPAIAAQFLDRDGPLPARRRPALRHSAEA